MSRLNPEKFIDQLASEIAVIDLKMPKDGTTSYIINRAVRGALSLLMTIVKNSTDKGSIDEAKELKEQISLLMSIGELIKDDDSNDEAKELKEQIIKLQIQITQLKKGKTGNL